MSTLLSHRRPAIPPAAPHQVSRDRLDDLLERATSTCPLVLVSAPAGYGKTTAMASWARATTTPVAWMTVERADNDLTRFLRGLLRAWERVDPAIGSQRPGILLGAMNPAPDAVAAAMIDSLAARAEPLVLVVDDLDVVDNPDLLEHLAWIVDHLPPQGHLVLGAREPPPLPLARWRARQQLIDIDREALRFTATEAASLFATALDRDVPPADLDHIDERVEGWAAGLQLATLAMRQGRVPLSAISGRQRFIAEFFRDEVLAPLPDRLREFVVTTCIVEELNASLAGAITGIPDAPEVLDVLERRHVFTMPLDAERRWYRYHRLFADALRAEFDRRPAADRRERHRRAARWYIEHELADPAFEQAMAAGSLPLVSEVLDRFAQVKLFSGQVASLEQWLRAIPPAWMATEPAIGLARAALLFFTGQLEACARHVDEIESTIRASGRSQPAVDARLVAMRCFIACALNDLPMAQATGSEALSSLAPLDDSFRASVLGALGDTYRRNGRWAEARTHYRQALQHIDNPEGQIQSVHAYGALADLEVRQGRLRTAADYWRHAIRKIEDPTLWGVYPLPLIGWAYIRHGEILYEWNELAAAREACEAGLARARLGGDPQAMIAGELLAARLHLAESRWTDAEAALTEARRLLVDAEFPEWSGVLDRVQVAAWLATGKLRAATTWADATMDHHDLAEQKLALLAVARVLLIRGDAGAATIAMSLLEGLQAQAAESGRIDVEIAALTLRATGLWARGERADALTTLEHALHLAEPEGYVRTFVDLGLPMARVLQEARARRVLPTFVDRLLAAFAPDTPGSRPATTPLPEPLSEREIEVVHLLAAGLSNREIADRLFISAETVKKHTGNIYSKLGVRRRTEAVARCRELGLLD